MINGLRSRVRPQMRADEQHRMVLQVLPDARQIGANLNAKRAQMCRRTDPGAHQQRRRLDCAATQNDLASTEFPFGTRDRCLDSNGAAALEQNSLHNRLRRDRQILSPPRRGIKVADGG